MSENRDIDLLSHEEIRAIEKVILNGDHAEIFLTQAGVRIKQIKQYYIDPYEQNNRKPD